MPSTNGHDASTGKIALYLRLSGEEQPRQESIGTQEALLAAYCKLCGLEVSGVFLEAPQTHQARGGANHH